MPVRLLTLVLIGAAACAQRPAGRASGGGQGGSGGEGGQGGATCADDADGDGHLARRCGGADCDDADAGIRPGIADRCGDGVDGNCNGSGGPGQPEDEGCCVPAGPEVCNGRDDDCDGIADEGVTNACGTCDDEVPCFVEEFHEPASCLEGNGRICDRISPDENNPDAFTLSSDRRGVQTNDLHAPVADRDRVVKLDTITGQRIWTADVHGDEPRHIAVPLDGSVWVGGGNVEHLDRDGNVICEAVLPARVSGLAIDPYGDVWASTAAGALFRISGTGVGAAGSSGLPLCDRHDLAPGDPATDCVDLGVAMDGLAISDEGVLWTGSNPAVRLDVGSLAMERVPHAEGARPVIDGVGDVWFAGASVHRVAGSGPYVDGYQVEPGAGATALAVDEAGIVWGTDGSRLVRIDPDTLEVSTALAPAAVDGCAGDDAGKLWALGTGTAHRFDQVNGTWDPFTIDAGRDTHGRGDLTGAALRQRVHSGSWTGQFESGYPATLWRQVDWQQLRPGRSVIEVTVRFADRREELAAAPACGPFTETPIDLRACEGRKRWIAITFHLRAARDGSKPTVGHVRVHWSRP